MPSSGGRSQGPLLLDMQESGTRQQRLPYEGQTASWRRQDGRGGTAPHAAGSLSRRLRPGKAHNEAYAESCHAGRLSLEERLRGVGFRAIAARRSAEGVYWASCTAPRRPQPRSCLSPTIAWLHYTENESVFTESYTENESVFTESISKSEI